MTQITYQEYEHQLFEARCGIKLEPPWLDEHIYAYRVKETDTHYIDVMRMIFNWRVAASPKADPWSIDRAWCYQGTGLAGFLPAVLAAMAWDGADDTEPPGYFKRAGA